MADKRNQVRQALAERPRLERLRSLSLPADPDLARREYESYLTNLVRDSGFEAGSYSITPKPVEARATGPGPAPKKPPTTRLGYTVQAHGTLDKVVKMLTDFYHTSLLHQVRTISLQRPATLGPQQKPGELDLNLTIEALVVAGADNRPYLLPNIDPRTLTAEAALGLVGAPMGMPLAVWAAGPTGPSGPGVLARSPTAYAAIGDKNVFYGQTSAENPKAEVEVTKFVYLTDITEGPKGFEAFLYDRYNNRKTRLRASSGFNRFRVTDEAGDALVEGQVVRIDTRDVVFLADGKHYALHVGQNVGEALHKPLSAGELSALTRSPAASP